MRNIPLLLWLGALLNRNSILHTQELLQFDVGGLALGEEVRKETKETAQNKRERELPDHPS